MKKQEWFSTWFDTHYYHVLYQHRTYVEAEFFISNLLENLQVKADAKILDLACGKGRHAFFIAQRGFQVTGLDLSSESIQWAKENYALPNLNFDVHDMRNVYQEDTFDYVFNFFTSFGYFTSDEENNRVIGAMKKALKNEGKLVIDFMNVEKVIAHLKETETISLDGITFHISRTYTDGFIFKTIKFHDQGEDFEFFERVQALQFEDFKSLFATNNLALVDAYGDYNLQAFDAEHSDRLIMVLEKNA